MDSQDNQTIIRARGGTFDVESDSDKRKVSGGIEGPVLVGLNQWQQREQLTVHDFTIINDTHSYKQGYSIGDNTLKARTLMYNLNGKDILSIDALTQVIHAQKTVINYLLRSPMPWTRCISRGKTSATAC